MTTPLLAAEPPRSRARPAQVDLVVPVHDEEATLEASVRRLHAYLSERFPLPWRITIADNASIDGTWGVACRLAVELDRVRALHLDEKGRGRALRAAWTASDAPVLAYTDVDLSTDLDALLPLLAPLVSGHSDVAIGTRLAPGARVVRGPRRELISRAYNLLLKATLRAGFSDAQCGFKALRADAARRLLPMVEDDGWFFDTELLVIAERNGLRIHEVPVDWVDDPDSRVDVVRTATGDLRGVGRMLARVLTGRVALAPPGRPLAAGAGPDGGGGPDLGRPAGGSGPATVSPPPVPARLVRFASIGVVSTLLFAALLALLSRPIGLLAADVVALAVCSVVNTAANRRLTFALRGRAGRARHYLAGTALGVLPVASTLLALVGLEAAGVGSLPMQVLVLTAASAAGALLRLALLGAWAFRPVAEEVDR